MIVTNYAVTRGIQVMMVELQNILENLGMLLLEPLWLILIVHSEVCLF